MHDVWGIEQGLPHNSINSIIQTSDGYIWIGTVEGLARFDGVKFTVYNKGNTKELRSNFINTLFEDRKKNLWIGTLGGGLTRFKDGKFFDYSTKEGLPHNDVLSICGDKEGNIWIGTSGGGLARFKDGRFKTYTTEDGLSHNIVRSIYRDRSGNLWIGTNGGLNLFEEEKFKTYTTKDGLSHNTVRSIYEDRAGNLWIGTIEGLNLLKDGKFWTYYSKDGLSNNIVNVIYENREGSLWIGTISGLNRLRDGKFSAYSTEERFSDVIVFSICEDREGNLWIGTYDGLIRLKDVKVTTYTTEEGLSFNIVMSVYEDRNGNIWIGTYEGLNRMRDGKFISYTTKDGLSHNVISSIYQDRAGNLWIGSRGAGLNRFKDGKFIHYSTKEGLSSNIVISMCEDREGSLWIGTRGGLNRLKDGKFTIFTVKDGLSHNIVQSIYEDRAGNLWIGTHGGLNLLKEGKFTTYTTKDGLSYNNIRPIYEDRDGNLWIGTNGGGLNRFKDGKFTSYTTKEGLFNDVIHKILEDERGNLWMSCNNGIFRVNKRDLIDFDKGKINSIKCVSYGKSDGMKSSECNGTSQSSGFKSRDGRLWFPTMNGVAIIDPKNTKINETPPPVLIEEIFVDDKTIDLTDDELRLPPGKKSFEFHYTGLSFLTPEKVFFKYKLEGFDEDWLNVGSRRTAYYTNIPHGYYSFKVIACNNDGIWNYTGASFNFYLKPFFYQTWWFYGILIILFAFLVYTGFRLRIAGIKARNLLLQNEITERKRAENITSALYSISKAVNSTDNLDELFRYIHISLNAIIDTTNFYISLFRKEDEKIIFPYFVDEKDETAPELSLKDKESLTVNVIDSKKTLFIKEDEILKRFSDKKLYGTVPKIWLGVPLKIKGEIIGVVVVQSYTNPDTYSEEDIELLESVSEQIAVAIQRKRSEEMLKESEQLFRETMESTADGILVIGGQGQIAYTNEQFVKMWRLPDEILKLKKDEKWRDYIVSQLEDPKIVLVKFQELDKSSETDFDTLIFKDGRIFEYFSCPLIRKGEIAGRILSFRDVTEKRLAEEEKDKLENQLRHAQRMESIGTLAGGIAHDFNNLLMGLQGRISLMLIEIDASHPHFEHLKGMERYIKSATDLTSQLLGFARRGKYDVKPVDLNKIVKKQSHMFGRTSKNIVIHERLMQDLWTSEVDTGQIEQVLLNLYVNAWHAMPDGGDLYIQTENITIDEKYIKPYHIEPGRYAKISITDTGVGMDEETRLRIFDPFFTTKKMGRGTGLGLASVYGIIKNHGGFINVYSEVGEGTTINIYLPSTEKEVIEEKELPEEIKRGSETVLLVDDEDMIVAVGTELLEKLGYRVLQARSGKEALLIFNEKKGEIDLVILDMIMPQMDGGETFDLLKEINPDIKVLLSSGYSLNGKAGEILERGCNGFIQKPFNIKKLSVKIREILDS